ncbi:uncharacterized protein VTP21DRAFT_1392 [Calcarisporiella thermophila]|uniref:uncharacterized protein n=1 Tax=Calcarisporiella thermophila TaxID=911321 RepID=UPI0037443F90
MGKEKKEKKVKQAADSDNEEEVSLDAVSPIAHPLATDKLCKKLLKTVKKAAKQRHVRRGVKEVVKAVRKGEKGLVIIAGDISPIDVITHVPVLCEDASVPYCYVPSKEALGTAGATKRPTSVVMIVPGGKKKDMKAAEEYRETYDECFGKVKELDENLKF